LTFAPAPQTAFSRRVIDFSVCVASLNRATLLVHHQHLNGIAGEVKPVQPITNALQFGKRFSASVEPAHDDCGA
jgi:hypothetical protein